MIEYVLFNGQITLIDDEDLERIKVILYQKSSWYMDKLGYVRAWCKYKGYRKKFVLHRVIMNCYDNSKDVDHINRNPLDNRKCNLRICTHEENRRNSKIYPLHLKTSKYIGVGVYPFNKSKFAAGIKVNYKRIHLGIFNTEIEAAKARDIASIKYHKEFAVLNFPNEKYDKDINPQGMRELKT